MPRYHLHTCDGEDFTRDEGGVEVSGAAEARALALRALCEIGADVLPSSPDGHVIKVRLTDDSDRLVLELRLAVETASFSTPS